MFALAPGQYQCIYDHNIQTPSLKRLANQSQTLCGASLGRGNDSLYKWSRSHDQNGLVKHLKIFSFITRMPMILKHDMKHQRVELCKVCINHDPVMTMAYFTARSTWVLMHLK